MDMLNYLRQVKNFNSSTYLDIKSEALNNFFKTEKLDSAVIGISGGIDSAVALGLLLNASSYPDSPIKKVVGITMPIHGTGSTGQSASLARARKLHSRYESHPKFDYLERDLTSVYVSYIRNHVHSEDNWSEKFPETPFSNGQLLSIVRTPFLYYTAALLQEKGFKSITVGTTNRDEGGYIGFFGKASDAMVDLQPIADLHKSEVYEVASKLGIPVEIIKEKPKGDVYDGRCDEEMIGTSYDNVELFTLLKDFGYTPDDFMTKDALSAIESIHAKNAHKYKVGMPSRFVDIQKRVVEGGWK